MSKISLGTAQFGSKYGISNKIGKPDLKTINKIMNFAISSGISRFDTAAGYGDSEEVLGKIFETKEKLVPNITTKISRINPEGKNSDEIFKQIKNSLEKSKRRLNNGTITNYLLHNPADMNNDEIIKSLVRLKKEKLVNKIGVSTYTEKHVKKFLEIPEFEVIELPFNLFDTRLLKNELLKQISTQNKIIFARSVFLQGLFFIESNDLPPHLKLAKTYLDELYKISKDYKISITKLALTFVRDFDEITSLVIGVNNLDQIKMNIKLMDSEKLNEEIKEIIIKKFSNIPDEVINPSKWKIN